MCGAAGEQAANTEKGEKDRKEEKLSQRKKKKKRKRKRAGRNSDNFSAFRVSCTAWTGGTAATQIQHRSQHLIRSTRWPPKSARPLYGSSGNTISARYCLQQEKIQSNISIIPITIPLRRSFCLIVETRLDVSERFSAAVLPFHTTDADIGKLVVAPLDGRAPLWIFHTSFGPLTWKDVSPFESIP